MEDSSLDGTDVQNVVCKVLGKALLSEGPPLKEPPDKPPLPPPDDPPPPDTVPDAGAAADAVIEKSTPLSDGPAAPAVEFLGADLQTIKIDRYITYKAYFP